MNLRDNNWLINQFVLPTFCLCFAFSGINFRSMLHHLCYVAYGENMCGPIRTRKYRGTNWLINCMTKIDTEAKCHLKIKFCTDAYFYGNLCQKISLNLDRASLNFCIFLFLMFINKLPLKVRSCFRFDMLGMKSLCIEYVKILQIINTSPSWVPLLSGVFRTFSAWKVSVFRVILVRVFPHSDWIRRNTEHLSVFSPNAGNYGPE